MDHQGMIRCAANRHTGKVTTTLAGPKSNASSSTSAPGAPGDKEAKKTDQTNKRKRLSEPEQSETIDAITSTFTLTPPSPVTPARTQRKDDNIVEPPNPTEYAASFAIANTPPPGDVLMSEAPADAPRDTNDQTLHPDANTTSQSAPSSIGLPTPQTTPVKDKDLPLQERGELADRYLSRTSTADGVEYKVPSKFSLKPPFWKRWSSAQYARFADYLREQVDCASFAKKQGVPVEEVQNVFNAIVCNPLYDAKEAKRRGEDGMRQLFHLANELGTPMRYWGNPSKEMVLGELAKVVEKGVVELILESGTKCRLSLAQLVDDDKKYLKETLTEYDKGVFWGEDRTERPMRHWGHPRPQDQKRLFGCFAGTEKGVVVVKTRMGKMWKIIVQSLVQEDLEYLGDTMSAQDKGVLWDA